MILVHIFQLQILNKNDVIFGVDNSSSVHIDNKKKDTLILGKGSTQVINNTAIAAEAKYSIDFLRAQKKFCLSLHYRKIVLYSLMPQKYINLKQETLK